MTVNYVEPLTPAQIYTEKLIIQNTEFKLLNIISPVLPASRRFSCRWGKRLGGFTIVDAAREPNDKHMSYICTHYMTQTPVITIVHLLALGSVSCCDDMSNPQGGISIFWGQKQNS